MVAEGDVLTAVVAAINAGLPASVRAYDHGKVPSPRPNEFAAVSIVRRAGGSPRAGRYSTDGWAVYVMAASLTSSPNARNALRKASEALENKTLTVGGVSSTPVRFDTGRPVAPDDGWHTGVNTYHFTI